MKRSLLISLALVACAGESDPHPDPPAAAIPIPPGPLQVRAAPAQQTYLWEERNVPMPSRIVPAMIDQPARGRVLLFGGWAADSGIRKDTWEWDGFGWIRRVPNTDPNPRFGAAASYDDYAHRVILYGGLRSLGPPPQLADHLTWEWNGEDWTPIPTLHDPGDCVGGAAAWEPESKRMLMFGGLRANDGNLDDLVGTDSFWSFDGKELDRAAEGRDRASAAWSRGDDLRSTTATLPVGGWLSIVVAGGRTPQRPRHTPGQRHMAVDRRGRLGRSRRQAAEHRVGADGRRLRR